MLHVRLRGARVRSLRGICGRIQRVCSAALRATLTAAKVPEASWPYGVRSDAAAQGGGQKAITLSAFEEFERSLEAIASGQNGRRGKPVTRVLYLTNSVRICSGEAPSSNASVVQMTPSSMGTRGYLNIPAWPWRVLTLAVAHGQACGGSTNFTSGKHAFNIYSLLPPPRQVSCWNSISSIQPLNLKPAGPDPKYSGRPPFISSSDSTGAYILHFMY
ncbi:hypothetical protein C8R46DRAFT_1099586 [Mycena filopes]|nr:hypothetical protein C8R46DRAFT_1099586 [Mycena filopes]